MNNATKMVKDMKASSPLNQIGSNYFLEAILDTLVEIQESLSLQEKKRHLPTDGFGVKANTTGLDKSSTKTWRNRK